MENFSLPGHPRTNETLETLVLLLPLWRISFRSSFNSSLAKEFLFDDFIIGFVVQRRLLDTSLRVIRYYLPAALNDDSTRPKNLHKLKNISSSVRKGSDFSFCSIAELSMRS